MKRFLKPATGIYKKTAKPYKKLFQEIKMTFDIEIEGRKYRLVGFYPWFKNGLGPFSVKRYIVVDQEGKIIKDEKIVRLCTQAYLLIASMIKSEDVLLIDYSDRDHFAYELELLMQGITERLSPHFKGDEAENIRENYGKMISFFNKSKKTEKEMYNLTVDTIPQYKKILQNQKINTKELLELSTNYLKISKLSNERVILILDTAIDRGVVRSLTSYKGFLKHLTPEQREKLPKLLDAIDGANQAGRHARINSNFYGRTKYEDIIKDLQAEPFDWLTEKVDRYFTERWIR